jgi:hypothetical protein
MTKSSRNGKSSMTTWAIKSRPLVRSSFRKICSKPWILLQKCQNRREKSTSITIS